ncbi:MAG TPA: YdcF family protein [Candidatus Sulfotelmatobacter sp.]
MMALLITSTGKRRRRPWLILLLACVTLFALEAGRVLVVNSPQKSDLIVVLAGETDRRPALALDLLHQGYATRILLDVPASARIYDATLTQIAADYARKLPVASQIALCPIAGLSTRDESHDVAACLNDEHGATRILLVTSDYHTGRALSIFRHEIRGKYFSVAAAHDDSQFGVRWWTHRQWAKICLDEWLRLIWWNAIERWR